MTRERLSPIAEAIIGRLAPPAWRESLSGDLEEERRRRAARGRTHGALWQTGAALAAAIRLQIETRRTVVIPPSHPTSRVPPELRQAFRTLRRRPAFAALAVATLTIGIGANTVVFSLANWLMFRPIPGVSRPDDLVSLKMGFKASAGAFYFWSVPELRRVAELPGLSRVAASADTSFHVVVGSGLPIRVEGGVATSNYFDVLGQTMSQGRAFTPAADDPGSAAVAVVSDHFWRTALGADPNAIGRRLVLNGSTFEIIGVAARGFRGPDRSGRTDIWVPLASHRRSMPSSPPELLTSSVSLFSTLLARPAPGVSVDAINAQLATLLTSLAAADAKNFKYPRARLIASSGPDVPAWQREGLRQMFALLLGVAGLLLLLTCANVANLLFARAHERAPELATRQALGASRGRVVRQLVVESLTIACAGTVLALAAAEGVGRWITGLVVARSLPALSEVPLDWRVFAFAGALSAVTSVAAALAPAVFASRTSLTAALREGGRGQTPASRLTRRVLAVAQVAIAVTLVAVSLLLQRSLEARYAVPLGFDRANVLAFSLDASAQGYPTDRIRRLYADALARLRELPGVSAAGLAWIEPFKPIGGGVALSPADRPGTAPVDGDTNYVSDGFFTTLGVRIIEGRDFLASESLRAEAAQVEPIIVNVAMARRLFGTTHVVGRAVEASYPQGQRMTIVGVVTDIRTRTIADDAVEPTSYQPFGQGFLSGWGTIHVRLTAPAAEVVPRIRQTMRTVDPQLPIYDVETLAGAVDRYLAESRLLSTTIGTFALIATAVAALGLFGVLARGVEERRREFGIRAALGARPSAVAALVAREALGIALAGSVAGTAGAIGLGYVIQARLFGVRPADPLSLGLAVAATMAAAVAAALTPAARAARVNVVDELR